MRANEFLLKTDEWNFILELNGKIPMDAWCSLVEAHYVVGSKFLKESTDQTLLQHITGIEQSFSNPLNVGGSYIPVPFFLIHDHIMIYDVDGGSPARAPASFWTLSKINDDKTLTFTNPTTQKSIVWPFARVSAVSYMTVISINSVEDYKKLQGWAALTLGVSLPDYKE